MTLLILISGCLGYQDVKEDPPGTTASTVTVTVDTADTDDPDETDLTDTGGTDVTGDSGTEPPPDTGSPCLDTGPLVDFTTVDCSDGIAAVVDGVGYLSVDEAVAGVCKGETVVVCPGEWPTAAVVDRAIDLVSRDGPEATVLTGVHGSVLRVTATGGTTIRGLSITGGLGTPESEATGEVWKDVGPEPTWGGGVIAMGETNLVDCRIEGNTADYGGGVAALLGKATITLKSSFVADNTASLGGGAYGGYIGFIDSGVVRNHAKEGGGAYARRLELDGSTFESNQADESGGGLYCRALEAVDSRFVDNEAADGGAMRLPLATGSDGAISDSWFEGNIATGRGGGVYVSDGSFGGDFAVTGTTFRDNWASAGGGVAIDSGRSYATLEDTRFEENHASVGGGLYTSQYGNLPDVVLTDVDFLANVADEEGGAMVCQADITVSGGSLWGNLSRRAGGMAVHHGLLTVDLTDFGDGTEENVTYDVATLSEGRDLDGVSSFSCVEVTCTY